MARKAGQAVVVPADLALPPVRDRWEALAVFAIVPFVVQLLLFHWSVPLGRPGQFVYLYSPVAGWRMNALWVIALLAVVIAVGVRLAFANRVGLARIGLALAASGSVGVAFWSYLAPPDYFQQHVFNMFSPSQDGAFLLESFQVDGVTRYLRDFPERAHTPPAQMRGTRVISNPPGTTLLAVGVGALVDHCGPLRRYLRAPLEAADPGSATFAEQGARGIALAWTFTLLWWLSGVVFYAAGRRIFSPASAAMFALVCLVSPMTLLFTPGKDPAQLLIVAVLIWLTLLWRERERVWAAAAAGAVLVGGCLFSLVFAWLGLAIGAALLLAARRAPAGLRRFVMRGVLPTAVGALAAIGVLYLTCGLNVPAAMWAVAQAQAEVTRGSHAMPFVWQVLGMPLFLLFAGPALLTVGWWSLAGRVKADRSDDHARFGRYLLLSCTALMIATVAFTNLETPRLWIPFAPLLLLGATLTLPEFRQPKPSRAWLLVALAFVQIAISGLQWSLMDMREAEVRLLSEHFFR